MKQPITPPNLNSRRRRQSIVSVAALVAATGSMGLTHPAYAQKVFIGSGNGWQSMITHPDQWTYVRQNSDGFYVNFIELLHTDAATMRKLSPLFTHRNAYYESDSRYTGLGGFPDGGQFTRALQATELSYLLNGGFSVPYTSLNYGFDDPKAGDLRHQGLPPGKARPCFAQYGPWEFRGDLNKNVGPNQRIRTEIGRAEGATTDGPLSLWKADQGQMRAGSYSLVKYAHGLRKTAAVMVSPYDLKPRSLWLEEAQSCVREHEDAGAKPDIWIVFEYATDTPTLPETVEGRPANTITGMAYWLLHHLHDPAHFARLTLSPPQGASARTIASPTTDATTASLVRPEIAVDPPSTTTVSVSLDNRSDWLDLCPVLQAKINDPGHQWNVTFALDGRDVTPSMTSPDGISCVGNLRLWPGAHRQLDVTFTRKESGPLSAKQSLPKVRLTLRAHAGTPGPEAQTITLQPALAAPFPETAAR